jgi:hypothetical protein
MDDLEVAKQRLRDKKLNLVFVKKSKPIFETSREGLGGFLQAIEELNGNLFGSSVADKIIGRAAALLCAHSNIKTAFAVTLSQSALEILNNYNIYYEFETLVPTILNLRKTDKCPFEKLVENIHNPKKAHEKIKQLHNSQTQTHNKKPKQKAQRYKQQTGTQENHPQ